MNAGRKKVGSQPLLPHEICSFGKHINQAINYYEERYPLSSQHRAPSRSVIVPALLLLSQIRLTSSPSDKPPFISDRDIPLPSSDNTIHRENSDSYFNVLLTPVVNALYKTGEMISRYDPLKFPAAEAAFLSGTVPESVTPPDIHFLSKHLAKKTDELISTISDSKQKAAIKRMINELNNISIEAEKEFPSKQSGYKNIEYLIFVIDKSKHIIDKFEIKYGQDALCEMLNLQRASYIKIANDISDNKSQLTFQKYIESLPSLTFTSDPEGDANSSVESQIAGNLVRSVFGFENDREDTTEYGSRYEAYRSLLTSLLAEKKIGSTNDLPAGWDKGDEALRLVSLLLRDLELNLNSKGEMYLLQSAEICYLAYRKSLIKNSALSDKEKKRKLSLSYSDRDKLLLLKYHLKNPIEIEYNEYPDSLSFFKLLDLFITIQCITEAMHHRHLPAGRKDSRDYHPKPRINTHSSYQQCKNVEHLKPEYNRNTHKLTLHATSGKNRNLKENNTEMKKLLSENERIDKIEFSPNLSLRHVKNHSSISKELKKIITPEMYAKDTNEYIFSLPDNFGLIHNNHDDTYLRINKKMVKIKHIPYPPYINNRYFIEDKTNGNLYLRYREDEKFHPETFHERLYAEKVIDFGEIISNVEPLTSDERHALRAYGRADANNINEFLRKGMPENYFAPDARASIEKIIDGVQHALNKTTPYKGEVYKYHIINTEEFNHLEKGQLLTSKTFLSCTKEGYLGHSLSRAVIDSFNFINSHNLTDTHSVILYTFNIKKSGHSLEWLTEKFHEDEVLIESNKYYRIRDIYSKSIILDEIDDSLLSNEEKYRAKKI